MAGNSVGPLSGLEVSGSHGRYLLKDSIGKGGNGEVYEVDIVEGGETLPHERGYALKHFNFSKTDGKEYKKRQARFIKEIKSVRTFQNDIEGVLPIYDSSIDCDEDQEPLWFLMPRAVRFNMYRGTFDQKLEHLIRLGNTLKQLHFRGYAHRDIKPSNLLFYKGRIHLTDYGLIWNAGNTDDNITEVNDQMGPWLIRPPELRLIVNNGNVDYRKSDVYLFAKTVWMVLQQNNEGFYSCYSRSDDNIYIDRKHHNILTAEPLHRLMEAATKHNFWERIDIDECLSYLNHQLRVFNNEVSQNEINALQYDERTKRIDAVMIPNEKVYTDPSAILVILSELSEIAYITFLEPGREYGRYPLRKANHIDKSIFEIEIQVYNYGRSRKTILIMIESIRSKNREYEIQLMPYSNEERSIPVFTQIGKALECPEKRICLNTDSRIKINYP